MCAQEGYASLGLDGMWLMPAGEAPHKQIEQDPGRRERYLMCDLAAWGAEWLDASHLEIDRPGPSYTVDTLRHLRRERPDDEIVWMIGADQALSFPKWREPEEILRLARIAVARRDGIAEEDVHAALSGLDGGGQVTLFEMPTIDVSSTDVRARIAAGRPFRFLVPERVADRIDEQHLYRAARA